jgi:serine/threonine protein kinase
MSENKSPLMPGAKLGSYTLGALLGRGRNTEVYRASSPDLKHDAALKVYAADNDRLSSAAFKNEVRTIAALKHPNIMRLYDYGTEGSRYYIVMELIDGTGLRDLISAHPTGLERAETMRIFSQLASAVACAHDQKVVHGNIKADNVLLDHSQRPVLTDFNIPCLRECGDAFRANTPAYIAPEQVTGDPAIPQSDIYALGILLYEMVSGDVPFKSTNYEELIAQHRTTPPKPPGQIVVGLDPRIEEAVLKALSKDPAERYGSAREMLSAIESQESANQYQTVSFTREQVHKRRSEIKRFQESRLDDPPAETRPALPVLPVPPNRLPLIIGGIVLLVMALIVLIALIQ